MLDRVPEGIGGIDRPETGAPLRVGDWRVDPRADEIESGGRVVKLEPLHMKLLLALAARPRDVVLTQELLDQVWAGLVVTPNSVYQAVAQLRRQLGDNTDDPNYIQTVPRKGYRLVAPVVRGDDGPALQAAAVGSAPPVAVDAASGEEGAAVAQPQLSCPIDPQVSRAGGRRLWLLGIGAVAAAAGVARYLTSPSGATGPLRIAVLPFTDATRDGADRALTEGIAADIGRALGRYPAVDVIAPESLLKPGVLSATVAELGRRLAVGFVLLGTLLRDGPRLRLSARLVQTAGERERWQREFEQPLSSLAQLPEMIAGEVASALQRLPQLPQSVSANASAAYELYLLGVDAWRPKTMDAFLMARAYFTRGTEVDPEYARNYVGLGWTWIGQLWAGAGIDWGEAYARATPLFEKALRLDPDSAEALTAQGVLLTQARRFQAAREVFDASLKLAPGIAQTHHSYGVAEFEDGWPQRAAAHFKRAAELNPLSVSPWDRLGLAQVFVRQVGEAERSYARGVEVEPEHPNGYWGLGIAGYARGDLAAAVRGYRQALEREPRRPFQWHELAMLYLDLQKFDDAQQAYERVQSQLPRSLWPRIASGLVWAARGGGEAPPAALALTPANVPEDGYAVDVMIARLLGGAAADLSLTQRAIDMLASKGDTIGHTHVWFLFQGRNRALELATVLIALGQTEQAVPRLKDAEQELARLRTQGNVWHAWHFHQARLQALLGNVRASLDALDQAVQLGSRRAWWMRADPALAAVRAHPRFAQIVARIDEEVARQRQVLGGTY
jgi:DNA-binding winged helix-turn-helix (wHTH) protein/tetratricopeptide (TPR) repeat protein